jgi:Tat protein secretion system quality control protein TatD with DNase activity
MAKLFDTHSHYTDEKLFGNEELLAEIFAGDVGNIITVAVDVADSEKCLALASGYENM